MEAPVRRLSLELPAPLRVGSRSPNPLQLSPAMEVDEPQFRPQSVRNEPRASRGSSTYSTTEEWQQRLSRLSMTRNSLIITEIREDHVANIVPPEPVYRRDHAVNPILEVKQPDTPDVEQSSRSSVQRLEIDRDLRSRNLAAIVLLLGILAGIASLIIGCKIVTAGRPPLPGFFRGKYINMGAVDYPFLRDISVYYINGHVVANLPEVPVMMVGLVLNIFLTLTFDCMNFIQSATLRWALCKEGRLVFNSNPRLFTGARQFAPNSRVTNAVSSMALVLGYGSISVLTCSIYVVGMTDPDGYPIEDQPVPGDRYAIDFNGWGFVGLGVSLLVQGTICSWCLLKSRIVPTWNTNPFNTALVCAILGLTEQNGRHRSKPSRSASVETFSSSRLTTPHRIDTKSTFLSSYTDKTGAVLASPLSKQPSMRTQMAECRRPIYYIWVVFAFIILWLLMVVIFGIKAGSCTEAFVLFEQYKTDPTSYWHSFCRVKVPYWKDIFIDRRDWAGLLIQSLGLSFITLGIDCLQLLTDGNRDESAWRKATTTGADAGRGAVTEALLCWESWVLFAFKCLAPWIFGFAFETNLFVYTSLYPVVVLAILMLMLGFFAEYLSRRKPKGPQPAVYGNIAKLAALVDEWHPVLFWGDKGMIVCRIRKAGTAGRRLADLDMSMLYTNLRV